jgi:U3 small nucleolar RNA-associated protein 25
LIKGARHVIFYGLPEHSEFYPDHVNRLNDGLEGSAALNGEDAIMDASASSLVLFSKYESHALERIVGSSNCSRMVKGDKSTFLFST